MLFLGRLFLFVAVLLSATLWAAGAARAHAPAHGDYVRHTSGAGVIGTAGTVTAPGHPAVADHDRSRPGPAALGVVEPPALDCPESGPQAGSHCCGSICLSPMVALSPASDPLPAETVRLRRVVANDAPRPPSAIAPHRRPPRL